MPLGSRHDYKRNIVWAVVALGILFGLPSFSVLANSVDDRFSSASCEGPDACVRVSVKHILDADGNRSVGYFARNEDIQTAIEQANTVLANSGASWRLVIDDIVNVGGISQYFDMESHDEFRELEIEAEQDPELYAWRFDAINFYIANTIPAGGICSYPIGDDIIAINNFGGILNLGLGWLHEVGHYLSLTHTFDCLSRGCDPAICTGVGAYHGDTNVVRCPDNCPDQNNVMSYYQIAVEDGRFSSCQLAEMAFELFDPGGSRGHVLGDARPAPSNFSRGDTNDDGALDVADAIALLARLFQGVRELPCEKSADVDDSGRLDLTDAVALLDHAFLGGPEPISPYPLCGPDPTEDALLCESYGSCE